MDKLPTYRVCVYVPSKSLEEFIEAISSYIPSFLGGYDNVCWWSEKGVEQYRKIGKDCVEVAASHRVEISLPYEERILENFILDVIIPSHPWEEPVITITEQKIVNIRK